MIILYIYIYIKILLLFFYISIYGHIRTDFVVFNFWLSGGQKLVIVFGFGLKISSNEGVAFKSQLR